MRNALEIGKNAEKLPKKASAWTSIRKRGF